MLNLTPLWGRLYYKGNNNTLFGDPISDFLYINELTELLKKNGGYNSRDSITLLSCNTGAIPTDGSSNNRSLAQQLANNLDINVIAPVGKCYYIENYRAIWMVGSTTFYPEVKLSYWDTFLSWFS